MPKTHPSIKATWNLASAASEEFFAQFPEYPRPIAQLLYNRGLRAGTEITRFLAPAYGQELHDPSLLGGVTQAVAEIQRAITANQRIVVHGDYDADGITATALLCDVLQRLGADVMPFIPDRYKEGYGVAAATLERLHQEGVGLVITVDCGISSAAEVASARAKGLKVIVTDHHQPPAHIPVAEAVINPHLPGEPYPDKSLTGVGVAFKLAQALLADSKLSGREREAAEKWLLDLVALGTVADMAELRGENRTLVRYGLVVLSKTRRPGLRQLMRISGIDPSVCTSGQIGYTIAPRLNAAGRLTNAQHALELLLTDDSMRAEALARELNELNLKRQTLTAEALAQAKSKLPEITQDTRILIVEGNWLGGIVGLVAGRLAQQYSRPTVVIERGEQTSRGSARSIPALNMVETLTSQAPLLTKYGGHAGAAGFSLPTANLAAFREGLVETARQKLRPEDLRPVLEIEAELTPAEMNFELLEQLEHLEPFGIGNRQPRFILRGVNVAEHAIMGRDESHLKLRLETAEGQSITALAFGMASRAKQFSDLKACDIVGRPVSNTFNQTKSLEWHVDDFRSAQ